MAMKKTIDRLTQMIALAIAVVCALVFSSGCSGNAAGGASSNAETTDAAATADDAKRTEFGGISFVLPDGWESEVSGDSLTITAPEKKDELTSVVGSHSVGTEDELAPGEEEKELDTLVGYVLDASADIWDSVDSKDVTMKYIDGQVAETVKCDVTQAGKNARTYIFVILIDDGTKEYVTHIMFTSTVSEYYDDFEAIIDSIKIA